MASVNQKSIYLQRQARLADLLRQQGFKALLLNPGPSLSYFSGMYFHLSSRPVGGLFTSQGRSAFILPELEAPKADHLPFEHKTFTFGENPTIWKDAFKKACSYTQLVPGDRIGVEPRRMRYLELALFQDAFPDGKITPAGDIIASLRAIKDHDELLAMQTAVRIAEEAFLQAQSNLKTGMEEKEVAAELTLQLLRNGSEPELPFFPLVSSGPNGANPHAIPGDRRLVSGDLVIIDWGATYKGYISDITRTFAIDELDPELEQISQIVLAANQAGRKAVCPGIAASIVDKAARQIIEQAGYGPYFIHRTGHGIGLEGHEEPYIRADNSKILLPGMTFTVEPGIYIPGHGGVRIEDDVLITDQGSQTLTTLPRALNQLIS